MRRQLRAKALLSLAILIVVGSGVALAQYGARNPYLEAQQAAQQAAAHEEMAKRIAIDVIAAILGFVAGAAFSPLLRHVRRFVFYALLALGLAYAWFGDGFIADGLADALAIFCFFGALGYGLKLGAKTAISRRRAETQFKPPSSFGTAKWATESYLHEHHLFDGKGFLLGEFAEDGKRNTLHYNGGRHLLTVAPTRSGKGVSSIIPNLLNYEGSVFIIDPKGENAMITAPRRGKGDPARHIPGLGQSVFLLDPWNIAASDLGIRPARFNPLDWIKADDPDAAENAFLLADALVPTESQSQGEARFWDDEAKALLMGIILFVATSPKEAANRHLGRVRDIILLDEEGFKAILATMYNEPLPIVASTAARTAGKDVKLRSNVLASVQAHTHFLDSPRIRESLGSSDFGFDDLKNKPTTVYLILPADRLKTFDRWLRLLIQQAITVNARDITNKPEKPVLFLLDEMASLGRLSMVEQAYGLMAGFGMQLWGIVQDLSQLERIYGDGWQTFISNSGVIQYFGSRDKTTAEYFSTLCGVTTIRIMSLTYALGSVFGTAFSSSYGPGGTTTTSGSNESESHTHTIGSNESQRQLAYPDELMVLKNNDQIIFVENLDPIRSTKIRWYQDASLRALGVNLHPEIETQVIDPPPDQIVAPPKQAQVPPIPAFIHSVTQAVTNSPVSISVREFLKPELLPAQPVEPQAIVQPKPEPYVVKRHEQGDTSYAIYSDNTIQMTTPTSSRRFQSMADLKTHLASLKAPAEKDNA